MGLAAITFANGESQRFKKPDTEKFSKNNQGNTVRKVVQKLRYISVKTSWQTEFFKFFLEHYLSESVCTL